MIPAGYSNWVLHSTVSPLMISYALLAFLMILTIRTFFINQKSVNSEIAHQNPRQVPYWMPVVGNLALFLRAPQQLAILVS